MLGCMKALVILFLPSFFHECKPLTIYDPGAAKQSHPGWDPPDRTGGEALPTAHVLCVAAMGPGFAHPVVLEREGRL